jgi:hypothetical protein
MAEKKKNRTEWRVYLTPELDMLIRAIATFQNQTLSSITQEALKDWAKKPEQQEVIDRHNLDQIP